MKYFPAMTDLETRFTTLAKLSSERAALQYCCKEIFAAGYKDFVCDDAKNPAYIIAAPPKKSHIALVAHCDTVASKAPKKFDEWCGVIRTKGGGVLGADDRAGLAAILTHLAQGFRPHIILTTGEERGLIGAKKLAATHDKPHADIRVLLQLDRANANDFVTYDCDSPILDKWVSAFGYVKTFGSCSDISAIAPVWNIAAANLSVGYYEQHRPSEHLCLPELGYTISRLADMARYQPEALIPYVKKTGYVHTRYTPPTSTSTTGLKPNFGDGYRELFPSEIVSAGDEATTLEAKNWWTASNHNLGKTYETIRRDYPLIYIRRKVSYTAQANAPTTPSPSGIQTTSRTVGISIDEDKLDPQGGPGPLHRFLEEGEPILENDQKKGRNYWYNMHHAAGTLVNRDSAKMYRRRVYRWVVQGERVQVGDEFQIDGIDGNGKEEFVPVRAGSPVVNVACGFPRSYRRPLVPVGPGPIVTPTAPAPTTEDKDYPAGQYRRIEDYEIISATDEHRNRKDTEWGPVVNTIGLTGKDAREKYRATLFRRPIDHPYADTIPFPPNHPAILLDNPQPKLTYCMLRAGDIIREGDQWFDNQSGQWHPARTTANQSISEAMVGKYRRPVGLAVEDHDGTDLEIETIDAEVIGPPTHRILTPSDTFQEGDEFEFETKEGKQWKTITPVAIGLPIGRTVLRFRRKLPATDPGEGYRLLNQGEIIQSGDDVYLDSIWTRATCIGTKCNMPGAYRRPLPLLEPVRMKCDECRKPFDIMHLDDNQLCDPCARQAEADLAFIENTKAGQALAADNTGIDDAPYYPFYD